MKELIGITQNLLLLPLKDGTVMPGAEMILVATEPDYEPLETGQVAKSRPHDTFRIFVNSKNITGVIEALLSLQESIEKMGADYNSQLKKVEPPSEPTPG